MSERICDQCEENYADRGCTLSTWDGTTSRLCNRCYAAWHRFQGHPVTVRPVPADRRADAR
jgi:hypothetical protein